MKTPVLKSKPDYECTFMGHPMTWVATKRDGKSDKSTYGEGHCWRWRSCRALSKAIVVRAWPNTDVPHQTPCVTLTFFDRDTVEFDGLYSTGAELDRLLKRAEKLVKERTNVLINVVGQGRW